MEVNWPFMGKRDKVYAVWRQWATDGRIKLDDYPKHLWQLLGRPAFGDERRISFRPSDTMTDAEVHICEALAGPNGWTIYKALLARWP